MERGRRLVFCGIGVCVVLLLAFWLIIAFLPAKEDKKKKPDDAQTEEPSAEIPKQYLVSEISSRDKSKNEVEETVLFEYDELGRWSKVTRGYREWGEWEQLVYEFSYSYVNGEPYTVVVLSGLYETTTQTNTYDSFGRLRRSEKAQEDPQKPGRKVVLSTVLYDNYGRETLMTAYDLSGRVKAKEEREYDIYGNYTKWVLTEWDNQGDEYVSVRYKSECDETGRVVRYLDPDSERLIKEFQYLDDGSRIEVEYDFRDGSKVRESCYDSEGRMVKQEIYVYGSVSTYEREYTPTGYIGTNSSEYPEGKGILSEFEYDSAAERVIYSKDYKRREEFCVVRDDTGRILCEERKDFEGHILYKKAYEYDKEGNLISEEDNDMLTTYKYVTVSLTEEQEKARAQFFLDEEMYRFDYFLKY